MPTINFSSVNDFEVGQRLNVIGNGYSSGSPLVVKQGQVVTFNHSSHDGFGTPSATAYTTSSVWNPSSSISISYLGATSKTVSLTAPLGSTTVNLTASGYTGDTAYLLIESNVDTDPSPISVTNVTFALKLNYYETQNILVSNISTSIPVSGSAGVTWSKNGASFTSGATSVVAGDLIKFRQQASNYWGATVTRTLVLGDWSSPWSITNQPDPGSGEILLFTKTAAPLKGSDLTSFYGGNKKLSEFLKSPSGNLIPDIIKNNGVPTSALLKFSQLINTGTVLYFDRLPQTLHAGRNTVANGAGTITVQWLKGNFGEGGWDVGFGQVSSAVLVKYTLYPNAGMGGVTMAANNTSGFSLNNTWVTVSASVGANTELELSGRVLIQVKHKDFQSQVISLYVNYFLNAYGV